MVCLILKGSGYRVRIRARVQVNIRVRFRSRTYGYGQGSRLGLSWCRVDFETSWLETFVTLPPSFDSVAQWSWVWLFRVLHLPCEAWQLEQLTTVIAQRSRSGLGQTVYSPNRQLLNAFYCQSIISRSELKTCVYVVSQGSQLARPGSYTVWVQWVKRVVVLATHGSALHARWYGQPPRHLAPPTVGCITLDRQPECRRPQLRPSFSLISDWSSWLSSVLWHCCLCHRTCENCPQNATVSSRMLLLIQSLIVEFCHTGTLMLCS